MSCPACGDLGMVRIAYRDGTLPDYAVCLCPAANWFRSDRNAGKSTGYFGWQVWAYQNQIDPERVRLLEDALEPSELAEAGFGQPTKPASREAALLAASKARRAKL